MNGLLRFLMIGVALGVMMLATACIPPRVDNRGHLDAMGNLEKIAPGHSNREDVSRLLGTPSLSNQFGEERWYYVHGRKESVAFLSPEITDQRVIMISFDAQGTVREVKQYNKSDAQDVAIADDVTPTEGQELGFFEQILGNVGRFNAADRQGSRTPVRR